MKLGGNLFQKEKRINELTEENYKVTQMYTELKNRNEILEKERKDFDNYQANISNSMKIKEIEWENLLGRYNKLSEEYKLLQTRFQESSSTNSESEQKILSFSREIDLLNQKLMISQDLELKLRNEIDILEKRNTTFQKNIEDLNKIIGEKKQNTDILEKSIAHKDKYLALLIKEKERLLRLNENSQPVVSKKDKDLKEKTLNKPERDFDKELLSYSYLNQDESELGKLKSKVHALEKQVHLKSDESEKLKVENFNLLNRLRNKK